MSLTIDSLPDDLRPDDQKSGAKKAADTAEAQGQSQAPKWVPGTKPQSQTTAGVVGRPKKDGGESALSAGPVSSEEFRDLTVNLLKGCVEIITGRTDLPPRTGQAKLLADIVEAFDQTSRTDGEIGGKLLGLAPTGVGKSFSYLTPAAAAAALRGERTVISTEMISLQTQLIDKDAPVVAKALQKLTGQQLKVSLLKGWSNYACSASAVDTAQEILGEAPEAGDIGHAVEVRNRLQELVDKAPKRKPSNRGPFRINPDPDAVERAGERQKAELALWAINQTIDEKSGDKNTYPGSLADPDLWNSVSVSSTDCLGADKCKLAEFCLPRKARREAQESDIVVTNHSLMAVQAAKNVPIIIGSQSLGKFTHIVVDEAHSLPSIVRAQGSMEYSGHRLRSVIKQFASLLDDRDNKVVRFINEGDAISHRIDDELREWTRRIRRNEDVLRLAQGDDPTAETARISDQWLKEAKNWVKQIKTSTTSAAIEIKATRIGGRLDEFSKARELVGEHEPGTARWVELALPSRRAADQTPYPVARFTPVDVALMLRMSLWTTEDEEAMAAQAQQHEGDGPPPRRELSVVALSGTLPKGYGRQISVRGRPVEYESPFDAAYGASVLFVPRAVSPEDVAALSRPGTTKFDTSKHTAWAAKHLVDLVEANGGHALVLAATATAGREYAEALRASSKGRYKVLSQWDGAMLRRQVADWKDDPSAVLIGTKSLMTGVDASGSTLTLVVIDRPARSRSNPVDDARVEMMTAEGAMDKWSADRAVYVSDACSLLEQAAGRLIRSVDDSGMVAVLDPRLLKVGPFPYNAATRSDYLDALRRFETRIADPVHAQNWLREHAKKRK